jgi:hypothetical protein
LKAKTSYRRRRIELIVERLEAEYKELGTGIEAEYKELDAGIEAELEAGQREVESSIEAAAGVGCICPYLEVEAVTERFEVASRLDIEVG